jgi:serine phosphatase RsbU (regulator of sigma subunit)
VGLWVAIGEVFDIVVSIWLASLLLRRAWQGAPDARLFVAPVLLRQLLRPVDGVFEIEYRLGLRSTIPDWISFSIQWPLPMGLYEIIDALFLIAMLAILLSRFSRVRRQEDEHMREREAARSVQQVLIPETIAKIPGFQVASVYKPFGEVGGDFFQVIPIESGAHSGSMLVVIGDVSGKGIPAAMTVSLLVGTFRTLAHYTQESAEILAAMNTRMLARSNGGFTTCMVLRAGAEGTVTAANAGHISPYLNGNEIALENGLPLGLAAEAGYRESSFHLAPGDQLTLVTDGVVEARSKSGELFGFERMQTISHHAAEFIALTAQEFGQDDDITTVTLSLAPLR